MIGRLNHVAIAVPDLTTAGVTLSGYPGSDGFRSRRTCPNMG